MPIGTMMLPRSDHLPRLRLLIGIEHRERVPQVGVLRLPGPLEGCHQRAAPGVATRRVTSHRRPAPRAHRVKARPHRLVPLLGTPRDRRELRHLPVSQLELTGAREEKLHARRPMEACAAMRASRMTRGLRGKW